MSQTPDKAPAPTPPPADPSAQGQADPSAPAEQAEQLVLSSPEQARTSRDLWLWAGVLVIAAMAAYGPVLRGEFLWDDDRYVQSVLWRPGGMESVWTGHLKRLLGTAEQRAEPVQTPQYYPMTYTSYWLEYQIFGPPDGMPESTTVFHVTNVLLHAGSAILIWFILRRLGVPGGWIAAAVFALHPINAESVAWITERKNVLSGTCMFGAILAYLGFAGIDERTWRRDESDEPGVRWDLYAVSLGLFVVGLLAKSVIAVTPGIVLVLLWWKRRLSPRHVALVAPMLFMAAVMAYITVRSEVEVVNAQGSDWDISFAQRLLIAGLAPWFYAAKVLLPIRLTFIYPRWQLDPGNTVLWLGPIAVVVLIAVLTLASRRIGRGPLAAVLIFGGTLVPALGFFDVFPFRYSFVADHFQYHATPALIAAVIAVLAMLLGRFAPRSAAVAEVPAAADADKSSAPWPVPYVLSAVLLVVLGAATWLRATVFDNNLNLWEDTIAKNPSAWMAHNNLAYELHRLGREQRNMGLLDDAVTSFERAATSAERAVELRPTHTKALSNWGNALRALGRNEDAMDKYDRAIALDPTYPDPHYEKGVIMAGLGRHQEAVEEYRRFLELAEAEPGRRPRAAMAVAHEALADSLGVLGQDDAAIENYLAAIDANPRATGAMKDVAALYLRTGHLAEGFQWFARVTELDPNDVHAWSAVALLLVQADRLEDATVAIRQALTVDAQDKRALQVAEMIIAKWRERGVDPTTQMATPATAPSATQPAPVAAEPEVGQGIEQGP